MSGQPEANAARLRALVVDDAPELRMLLEPLLSREGFEVRTAADGYTCIELARTFAPDVIVLDLVLPGIDGLETCRRLRTFTDAYVVILTSKDAEMDRVLGLTVGADDYLAKPFSAHELIARVRAMLRRPRRSQGMTPTAVGAVPGSITAPATPPAGPNVVFGGTIRQHGSLQIDLESREVHVDGQLTDLTRIEFELLAVLTSRPRMVFPRTQLLELVWGPNWYGDTHVVDVHVSNLRAKLGDRGKPPRFIQTVRGIGFRLVDAEPFERIERAS